MSATVLVTVVGPDGLRADLAVPAEVPVAELLDGLRAALPSPPPLPLAAPGVEPLACPVTPPTPSARTAAALAPLCRSGAGPAPEGLALAPLGGAPLPPARSLAGCGIADGAVLVLGDCWAHGPLVRPGDHPARRGPAVPTGRWTRLAVASGWLDRPPPGPVESPGWPGWAAAGLPAESPGWPGRPPATSWWAGQAPEGPVESPGWPGWAAAAGLPAPWPPSVRLSRALRAAFAGPGWRRSVARGRRAWRDGSYERRLRAALAAAPLSRCVVVGVLGAAPRAGATTVTALLAAALAAGRPGRTAAVDVSPGPGSLTEMLAPCHDLFVDELVALLGHPMLTRRELGAVLARRGELAVLAARPGAAALDGRGWTLVVRALAAHATAVVADCGSGDSAGARTVLAAADQLVLVADAGAPDAAAAAAGPLAGHGRPPVLLLNRVPVNLEAAEVVERVTGVRGAVALPVDPAAAVALQAVPPPASGSGADAAPVAPLPSGPAAAACPVAPLPPGPADLAADPALPAAPVSGAPGAPIGGVPLPARWRRQADELAVLLAAAWPSLGP